MENQMEENVIFKLVIDDETDESITYANPKYMGTNPHFTVAPKMKMCTKEEFEEFIKNYPNKLHEDFSWMLILIMIFLWQIFGLIQW